jgi:glc operon protein GlcG
MMRLSRTSRALTLTFLAWMSISVVTGGVAHAQLMLPYGEAISLEQAKQVIALAKEEAAKNSWPVAIAVVDGSGFLVAFERLDKTQLGSVEVAIEKAKTSALFRRPTKTFEDTLAMGGANLKLLKLPGALPIEGGLPIVQGGKIIGAIGVSGVKSVEDGQIAAKGLEAIAATP